MRQQPHREGAQKHGAEHRHVFERLRDELRRLAAGPHRRDGRALRSTQRDLQLTASVQQSSGRALCSSCAGAASFEAVILHLHLRRRADFKGASQPEVRIVI